MKPNSVKFFTRTRIVVFAFMVVSSVNCSKYHGETEQYVVNTMADGAQVVPVSSSTASATLIGTYNSNKNLLNGVLSWSGLSGPPTMIHLHGPARTTTSRKDSLNTVVKPKQSTAGSMDVSFAFIEAYEAILIDKMVYFDIHTAAFPNGEVRGQIILQ